MYAYSKVKFNVVFRFSSQIDMNNTFLYYLLLPQKMHAILISHYNTIIRHPNESISKHTYS